MSRSAWTWLAANVLFPLHERIKHHHSVALRRALEQTQWWPRAQIEELRIGKMRALLAHAADHVPYYREVFTARGIDVAAIRTVTDLARLPLLTKADIRAAGQRLVSETAGRVVKSNTGGSSGEPLTFFMGMDRVSHDVAAKWRATRWWGVDIGDRELVMWGSPIELGAQDRLRLLRDRVLRSQLVSAFDLGEPQIEKIITLIRDWRPAMLFGYPSAISMVAQHAHSRGIDLRGAGVRVVFVTSERLYDEQRAAIERAFGCPVANGYGGRDAGFIAHQCPAGSMHITAEDIVVETVRPDGTPTAPGEPGEIVVTHLANHDFPMIRYRTGDVGELDDRGCACGRGLPLLRALHGRSTDFVVTQDGTPMHGLALIYVVRELEGVAQFKIVQESREHTRVLIVPGQGYAADAAARIERGMRRRLGEGVRVEVLAVDHIEPERSGKFRYVVSHVAQGQP